MHIEVGRQGKVWPQFLWLWLFQQTFELRWVRNDRYGGGECDVLQFSSSDAPPKQLLDWSYWVQQLETRIDAELVTTIR